MKFYISTLTILGLLATTQAQKCKMNKSQQQAGSGTAVDPVLAAPKGQGSSPSQGSGAGSTPSILASSGAMSAQAGASTPPPAVASAAAGAPSSVMSQYPEPSQYPGQGTGVGRGPTGKCLYGRNYCGYTIRDLHTYEDLKAVYCSSNLCPYQNCGGGATCNPTETEVYQSVYQCDDLVANFEGTSVFFLGSCATSGWVCVNPEPHCTTPRRARMAVRGLHY